MGAGVDVPDPFAGQVGVELRRADTRMAEQLLDDPQVGPTLEEVGRERVAERVRRHPRRRPAAGGRAADDRPGLLARRAVARGRSGTAGRRASGATCPGERQPGRTHDLEVARQPVEGDLADRHEPLAVALADDPDEPAVEREVLAVQPERLADPQPGGVEQLEQRPVADPAGSSGGIAAGRLEEPLGLADVEGLGQEARPGAAGRSARRCRGRSGSRRRRTGRSRGSRRPAVAGSSARADPGRRAGPAAR